MILQTHSYMAYLALILLLFAVAVFKIGWFYNKPFTGKEQKLALITLVVFHLQLLIGLAWYFMSPYFQFMMQQGMGETMKITQYRLLAVEHPLMMVLAIILITMGYSKHKKKTTNKSKYSTLMWYYGIALLLILLRLPWQQWFD